MTAGNCSAFEGAILADSQGRRLRRKALALFNLTNLPALISRYDIGPQLSIDRISLTSTNGGEASGLFSERIRRGAASWRNAE